MTRTIQQQTVHNNLVRRMVEAYYNRGYFNLRADHIGLSSGIPGLVNGYRPDISASKDGLNVICEVETSDSVTSNETINQWKAFSASGYPYHVLVPKSCYELAWHQSQLHNIRVDMWWTVDDL